MPVDDAAISCRVATIDDIPALASLRWDMEMEWHPERGERLTQEQYVEVYAASVREAMERRTHRAWIAFSDGEPVASVTLIWWMMPPSTVNFHRKRGVVSSVFTQPAYRRRGISRRLMSMLIEDARADGIDRLVLWASDMGRPLYESLGFAQGNGMDLDVT
ncbi:MAG TPA: GNAT family N-acetyltransferase [Ktedonobacterales bacterium]|nr:GNAT family N-acetyltransferase [Ktedonobacterales bacterium]